MKRKHPSGVPIPPEESPNAVIKRVATQLERVENQVKQLRMDLQLILNEASYYPFLTVEQGDTGLLVTMWKSATKYAYRETNSQPQKYQRNQEAFKHVRLLNTLAHIMGRDPHTYTFSKSKNVSRGEPILKYKSGESEVTFIYKDRLTRYRITPSLIISIKATLDKVQRTNFDHLLENPEKAI